MGTKAKGGCMTKECLIKKLTTPYYGIDSNLQLKWVDKDIYGFSRNLEVTTEKGLTFIIEWYHNLLTIYLPNGVSIWADNIFLSNSMPNHSMLDIRTTYKGVNSGFCIKIRDFD